MAKRVRSHELAEDIQGRLQLYRSGCAYYEDPQGQFDRLATKTKQPTQGEESAPDHTRSRPQEREREVRNENPPVSTE
jgi:hypothetical protein